MGWFGKKKAEDVVDDDLKAYFKTQTSGEKPAVQQPARDLPVTAESVSLALPEAKLQSRDKKLPQIAMDNCVEYEKAFSDCLLRGSLWERFTSCPNQKTMHDKCVELQTQALQVLGYDQAATDDQKATIKAQADDLMIQHIPTFTITESQVEAFKAALPSSSQP